MMFTFTILALILGFKIYFNLMKHLVKLKLHKIGCNNKIREKNQVIYKDKYELCGLMCCSGVDRSGVHLAFASVSPGVSLIKNLLLSLREHSH